MPIQLPPGEDVAIPYANFAFHVSMEPVGASFDPGKDVDPALLGAFSDISGLEAMMEHKVIKAGGRNYGAALRTGPVTRYRRPEAGAVKASSCGAGGRCRRADGDDGRRRSELRQYPDRPDPRHRRGPEGRSQVRIGWWLKNAMPVKFRIGDLNAGFRRCRREPHLVQRGSR
jgi:hypothetical protein